jgi:tetratricopeptide (TPR) repeat protein
LAVSLLPAQQFLQLRHTAFAVFLLQTFFRREQGKCAKHGGENAKEYLYYCIMCRKSYFVFILLLFCSQVKSQNFQKDFEKLLFQKDTAGEVKLLNEWSRIHPKDPELFIAFFNFYVNKSRNEAISLDNQPRGIASLSVHDTGTGETVAYINQSILYDSRVIQKGFDKIDTGIALYPARLDMRFGKIYMLGECGNIPEFTKEIIRAIDYGISIDNKWIWKDGKPKEDARMFFLGSMQTYVNTIYNREDNSLLPYMRKISQAILKYYPNHVESLSNIAITYLVIGDYDSALPYLLNAEKIASSDVIVLNNIAEAYKRKNDKANAIAYYEKVAKHGTKEDTKFAEQQILKLQKQ